MPNILDIIRRFGTRRSVLVAWALIAGPMAEAWWGLFFQEPMVPFLIDKLDKGGITVGQVLVLILPTLAMVAVGALLYSALKPIQPFVPDIGVNDSRVAGTTYYTVRIENGVPQIFHGVYAKIIDFVGLDGPSKGFVEQGARLTWGITERARETVTITSMSGATLVLAVFDPRDPDHFQVPIGISTNKTLDRHGSYRVIVEVGSSRSSSIPTKFRFTINEHDDAIEIGQITQLEK